MSNTLCLAKLCLIVSVKHSVTTEQLCEMRGSVHHAATYHPKGPGSCLSKFQNMKPVNRKRISLSGAYTHKGLPCVVQMMKQIFYKLKKYTTDKDAFNSYFFRIKKNPIFTGKN